MLFGNVNKLSLAPFVYTVVRKWINEAVIIAANNDEGRFTLSDDRVFVILATGDTEKTDQRKAEIHKKYIDIQILLEGEERIGYSNDLDDNFASLSKLKDDVLFIEDVKNENFVDLRPGDFALFYPNQIHRPMCAISTPTRIKKAVIKAPVSIFS
ncbi:YhcH/YjgK/YiaL family protein [Vibrio algarum]|uniref:YhcH/YjgK/YiaL family protein n=1 Tax=Vibrio algarum TaxID=3020714 RepID=A0ABT4YWI2_9VIBR|nr:YhcH/YjgK/YiaL family protein [Vibrio sp. KJ40-1]MDB1125944.1 YhcH/YjgK/YiaL family protein [Vibrio sp. KJ40-1]